MKIISEVLKNFLIFTLKTIKYAIIFALIIWIATWIFNTRNTQPDTVEDTLQIFEQY